MDPNEVYEILDSNLGDYNIVKASHNLFEVMISWKALDEWLSQGGFLPDSWNKE